MFPFFNFDVGFDFFGYKRCFLDFKHFDIRFFTFPRTSQLEKVTCLEQQMYDSDNTDLIDFATPVWYIHRIA